uniref:Uncharacterized protein n=1 Tax=Spongospora subterranea TaxID=70186 RepID=A0A0H5R843_9EUKA|eukprot:CRZ10283.1 hypothetical protein [Spongospora subterranea]
MGNVATTYQHPSVQSEVNMQPSRALVSRNLTVEFDSLRRDRHPDRLKSNQQLQLLNQLMLSPKSSSSTDNPFVRAFMNLSRATGNSRINNTCTACRKKLSPFFGSAARPCPACGDNFCPSCLSFILPQSSHIPVVIRSHYYCEECCRLICKWELEAQLIGEPTIHKISHLFGSLTSISNNLMQSIPQLTGLIVTMKTLDYVDPLMRDEFEENISLLERNISRHLAEYEQKWLQVKEIDWHLFSMSLREEPSRPARLWPVFGKSMDLWARRGLTLARHQFKQVQALKRQDP